MMYDSGAKTGSRVSTIDHPSPALFRMKKDAPGIIPLLPPRISGIPFKSDRIVSPKSLAISARYTRPKFTECLCSANFRLFGIKEVAAALSASGHVSVLLRSKASSWKTFEILYEATVTRLHPENVKVLAIHYFYKFLNMYVHCHNWNVLFRWMVCTIITWQTMQNR